MAGRWFAILIATVLATACTGLLPEHGYVHTLDFINHFWSNESCTMKRGGVFPGHPRARGPCPTVFTVYNLAPSSTPKFLLAAECVRQGEFWMPDGMFKCEQKTALVKVLRPGPDGDQTIYHLQVPQGCFCVDNLAQPVRPRQHGLHVN